MKFKALITAISKYFALGNKNMKEVKVISLLTLISFLVSLGISDICANIFPNDIKIGEQIIISGVLFVVFLIIELLYYFRTLLKLQKEEFKFWDIKNSGDNELYSIRSNFHKVVQDAKDEDDIFIIHFIKEFKKLSKKISEVAEKQELFVNADYFLNADNVIKVFPSYDESVWYYTWQIKNADNELFNQEAWCQFFEKTAKLIELKKMKEIKAILILPNLEMQNHERISKLLAFYKTNDGISCKILDETRFKKILDYNSFNNHDDFGIYGSKLLYIEKYFEEEVTGYFVKNKDIIDGYTKLFNHLWVSDTIALPNPSKETHRLSVTDLINFDKNFVIK